MKNDYIISDLLNSDSHLINGNSLVKLEETQEAFSPSNFDENKNFLWRMFNVQTSIPTSSNATEFADMLGSLKTPNTLGSDTVTLKGWKNIENISARLIECYDDVVVLECLIEKELGVYEEREFRISLFTGYELKIGNLFFLRFFDRDNETKIEIHNDPKLTSIKDFPKMDFNNLFKQSKLFKKRI